MRATCTRRIRLRPGIPILRTGPRAFVVVHPESGAQFTCGPECRYLLHLLQRHLSLGEVREAYRRRFRRDLSETELLEFVEQLRCLNLVLEEGEPDAASAGEEGAQPQPAAPVPPAPAPLSPGDSGAALNFVFDLLTLLFGWVLHPVWIGPTLVLAGLAATSVVHHWQRCLNDLHTPWDKLPALPLAFGLVTQTVLLVNLPRALSVGIACRRFGGRVRDFGFTFWNGLVPTFFCDVGDSLARMDDRGRWTILSISMWCQVVIGSAALLLWTAARPGSVWGIFWLWLVPPCAAGFLFNSIIFCDFCGYYLLCYGVDEVRLRERALAETEAWLTGRHSPEGLSDRERFWFRYYGVGYYLFRLVFDPLMLLACGYWLVQKFHGPGALVFVIGTLWWYSDSIGRVLMENETVLSFLRWAGYVCGGAGFLSGFVGWIPWLTRGGGSWWVRWPIRLLLLLGGIVAVAFTPYNYEIAGECRVFPVGQYGVRAQLADEIVQVYVTEGSYVQAGDVIATLSGRQVRAELLTAEAQLKKAEAQLDRLLTGHLDEQVQAAADKVESARAKLRFAQIEVERVVRLVPYAAKVEELDRRKATRDEAREQLDAAEANLAKLKQGFREENIRAAEAQVKKQEGLVQHYRELLPLLELRTPIAGHVVTPYLEQRLGQHVQPGDLVAVVQDNSKPQVEVAADEAAALDIQEGQKVNIRLSGMWGRLLTGRVQRISLVSEMDNKFGNPPVRTDREVFQEEQVNPRTKSGGSHVRVYVDLDEVPTNLSPDLTGYARIVVDEDDLLWRSLARPVARFLRTEVWYWLP